MHIRHLDWKTHTHIGLDLDETLASTMEGLVKYAQGIGQLTHISSIDQIERHDASGLGSDITAEGAMILWEGYGRATLRPESVVPVLGSIEGVRRLHEIGKTLSIVTARSNQESWKVTRTTDWVRSHFAFLGNATIHFVNHYSTDARPKSVVCKAIGVSLMFDDALENAYELCEHGIACVLLEKPWNRHIDFSHPLLYRVRDWREVITYLPS